MVAAAWIAGEDTIVLNFYADLEATLANWPCGGKSIDANVVRSKSFSLTLTSPAWINFGDMAEAGDGFVWDALSVVKTTWLLMQQRFGDERKVRVGPPQRNTAGSTRKRPEVRVITLRRPAGEKSTGESDREWKHRWMVRGHWRMQPWGPKRERVRPVWIAPHIKGPEDKPLIGGEKVYHLKR